MKLLTIGVSHYCEKARWALDRAGIEYTEDASPPMIHYASALRHRTRRTFPALVTRHGTLLDSTDILHFVDRVAAPAARLFPDEPAARGEVERLEHHFDEKLGPQTRKWAYSWGLRDRALMVRFMKAGATPGKVRALDALSPVIVAFIKRGLNLSDATIDRAQARIALVFEEVGKVLADGRPYLAGDRFTAADLCFAALAAPSVAPPGYGLMEVDVDTLPDEMRRAVLAMRSTPAGAFALRMYRDHRREVVR